MTERRFTPPTEFPAEYITSDGRKAVILGTMPCDEYPYAGYIVYEGGGCGAVAWKKGGGGSPSSSLHDIPKKQVLWANDVMGTAGVGFWWESREKADAHATSSRIAVIRREWVEGQEPEYFKESIND
jgi:hypothetical protein